MQANPKYFGQCGCRQPDAWLFVTSHSSPFAGRTRGRSQRHAEYCVEQLAQFCVFPSLTHQWVNGAGGEQQRLSFLPLERPSQQIQFNRLKATSDHRRQIEAVHLGETRCHSIHGRIAGHFG